VRFDPPLGPLLDRLHADSDAIRAAYADYFAFLNDPANGMRTQTLPFEGGLELSVRA
jgi:hypothetical protein